VRSSPVGYLREMAFNFPGNSRFRSDRLSFNCSLRVASSNAERPYAQKTSSGPGFAQSLRRVTALVVPRLRAPVAEVGRIAIGGHCEQTFVGLARTLGLAPAAINAGAAAVDLARRR
jgi:hypothetical protein